jgi:VanZ family protein
MRGNERITWRHLAWLWLPVVALMAAIFFASSRQSLLEVPNGALDFMLKKSGHVLEYGLLALLTLRAWRGSLGQEGDNQLRPAALAIIVCALYAASDELHQLFVPTRHGVVRDVVIDLAGVMAAVALAEWRRRRSGKAQS